MRRLMMGLGASVLLMATMASPSSAVTTTVVRGTASSNPDLARSATCSMSPAAMSNGTALQSQTVLRAGNPPTTPVPPIAPETGSRYYVYGSDPSYAKGPMLSLGAGDYPKALSSRVLPLGGAQYAQAVVIAYNPAALVAGNTVTGAIEYVGWAKSGVLPQSWSSFPSSTSAFTWVGLTRSKSSSGTYSNAWATTTSSYTLSAFASKYFAAKANAGWDYRVAVLAGCQSSVSFGIDDLSLTSNKSGARMWDYEGLASSVSATASSTSIGYGQPITIAARATANGGAASLRVVRCQGVTCQYVTSAETSSPAGAITFQVFPDPGWTYGVRFDGDSYYDPQQATIGAITVRPYLTAALGQRKAHLGARVRVGGYVGPCTGSARHMVIQRKVGRKWKKVGRAMAPVCGVTSPDQYSKLSGSFRAKGLGRWKLRLLVPAAHGYAQTTSHTLRLKVTRAPVRKVAVVHVAAPPTSTPVSSGSGVTTAPPPPPI